MRAAVVRNQQKLTSSSHEIILFFVSCFTDLCLNSSVPFLKSIEAGVFSAHCAIEIYAEVFELAGKMHYLEDFCSSFGADHYGLPRNTNTITLEKKPWKVPKTYKFGDATVTPLKAGEEVQWTLNV